MATFQIPNHFIIIDKKVNFIKIYLAKAKGIGRL